jgi:hypothetical protein
MYESQFSYLASGDRDILKNFVLLSESVRKILNIMYKSECTVKRLRIVETAEIVLDLNTPTSPYAQNGRADFSEFRHAREDGGSTRCPENPGWAGKACPTSLGSPCIEPHETGPTAAEGVKFLVFE